MKYSPEESELSFHKRLLKESARGFKSTPRIHGFTPVYDYYQHINWGSPRTTRELYEDTKTVFENLLTLLWAQQNAYYAFFLEHGVPTHASAVRSGKECPWCKVDKVSAGHAHECPGFSHLGPFFRSFAIDGGVPEDVVRLYLDNKWGKIIERRVRSRYVSALLLSWALIAVLFFLP